MTFQQAKFKKVKLLVAKYEEVPIDWEIKTFNELFEFLATGTNSRDDLAKSGDIQYIHYGDIHAKWDSILDCDLQEIPWIDKAKVRQLPYLKEGDLIMADASEDYEGSGASVLLKNVKDRKIVSGLHTIALRSVDDSIFSDFKAYLSSIKFVKNQIVIYVTGVSVYGLSKNYLKKIRIALPPIKEQQKIASILSKVSELIQKIDQIIKQTKRLKKGLIQRLLIKGIGHTEFKEIELGLKFLKLSIPIDWEVKKLEDLVELIDTPHYTSQYFDSGVPVIRTSDCSSGGLLNYDNTKFTSEEEYERRRKIIEPEIGDVLYTREAPPGIASILDRKKISIGQRIVLLKPGQKIKGVFLSYFLNSRFGTLQAGAMTLKTTTEHVNIEDIRKFKVALPPLKEQVTIIEFLETIDTEVTIRKNYFVYLNIVKKGLMQKLLTGQLRVRL